MTNSQKLMKTALTKLSVGIAWCLAWGDKHQPQLAPAVLQQMRQALCQKTEVPDQTRSLVEQVQQLQAISEDYFPEKITQLRDDYPDLWQQPTKIGLVYGGATKVKGYVFESAKLQDIRGASAILDRINIVDLKAFFGEPKKSPSTSKWLAKHFPGLEDALIPELIIYSTGGNILAFCPAAYVHDLANAIERRYTEETLTANSCAVGDTFKLLEIRFGLLKEQIENTLWIDWYRQASVHQDSATRKLVEAYFGRPKNEQDLLQLFQNRKSFNELAGKLAGQFNQRRSGNNLPDVKRPSRCYPPMFETHPYLVRDESDRRLAVIQATNLPREPRFSETLARKRIVGQRTKLEDKRNQQWYRQSGFQWRPGLVISWVNKFNQFMRDAKQNSTYYQSLPPEVPWKKVRESRTLEDIAKSRPVPSPQSVTDGFVAYIYADVNNLGGYIQKIRTPEEYQHFSRDIFDATEHSVYAAIAKHLSPRFLDNPTDPESQTQLFPWVHPFEIIAIGGDDVLLIVPADKALEIAHTIGEEFEQRLAKLEAYQISQPDAKSAECHRYHGEKADVSRCKLSMSMGVLITAYNTPIYYARKLTEQLLKSAKERAKELKEENQYCSGTVDFFVMKSVTMISSNISSFREEGLTKDISSFREEGLTKDISSFREEGLTKLVKKNQTLKLYAAPYTLHELGGLLDTAKALKESGFARSQLYQIRSLLERGKNTAMLNYRYFRVRLQPDKQKLLEADFEKAWCEAKTNNGNLAPWMFVEPEKKPTQEKPEKATYETIWRELVDLYPFIAAPETADTTTKDPTLMEETR